MPVPTKEEINRIRQQTRERDETEPRAKAAHYDSFKQRVVVELRNGSELHVPAYLIEGMLRATPEQIAAVEVLPSGMGLHWEELDIDLSVPAMVADVFRSEVWWRTLPVKGRL